MNLMEVVIALSLGATVLAAGMDVLTVSVRQQIVDVRQTRVQGDAYMAWRAVEMELRQATEVDTPAATGQTSDLLLGCLNYDQRLGPMDPAATVEAFQFCESGGVLYFYRSPGCPMPPTTCAAAGGLAIAAGVSHDPASPWYFSRPSAGAVRFAYLVSAQTGPQTQSQSVDETIAFNAAAGTNQ
ncbi:MAG: hypothetical protein HKL90_07745 [Elusimicrobia bacterium]|nr:hypothetical protein [Elusimicrobiota bacterium]